MVQFWMTLIVGVVIGGSEVLAAGRDAGRPACPPGTAWSSYNGECSRKNWCWQKLRIPASSGMPSGANLTRLEACVNGGR